MFPRSLEFYKTTVMFIQGTHPLTPQILCLTQKDLCLAGAIVRGIILLI